MYCMQIQYLKYTIVWAFALMTSVICSVWMSNSNGANDFVEFVCNVFPSLFNFIGVTVIIQNVYLSHYNLFVSKIMVI